MMFNICFIHKISIRLITYAFVFTLQPAAINSSTFTFCVGLQCSLIKWFQSGLWLFRARNNRGVNVKWF